jgi:hypothetical protein
VDESDAAEKSAIDKAIEAGRLLCEAKATCCHGKWLPFLERSGVPERKAQRYMKLARSGLKSDTVSDLGGIKAALAWLESVPDVALKVKELSLRAIEAEREAAQWALDHPGYSDSVLAGWIGCSEPRIKDMRRWAASGFIGSYDDEAAA